MVEEVCKNIYRINVPLPGNPLKELNSYLIRGNESDLLIDTGFRNDVCRAALAEGLAQLGSDPERRDVLATHIHADHCGMADLFAGTDRRIYMPEKDLKRFVRQFQLSQPLDPGSRFPEEGFSEELLAQIYAANPAIKQRMPFADSRLTPLHDGEVLRVGDYELKVLVVPGHTPGNSMLWLEKEQIMFTGDHILFDITPNITYWSNFEDSLGNYIDQLRRVRDYPVRLALPGHRQTGDYAARIDAIIAHHKRRLGEVLRILDESPGLCGYEIAGRMTWKIRARNWDEFPVVQKWFATGECMSHLDYHMARGRIRCEKSGGIRRYLLTDTAMEFFDNPR